MGLTLREQRARNKIRMQQKRAEQKSAGMKNVTVPLSPKIHNLLADLKQVTGKPYSAIIACGIVEMAERILSGRDAFPDDVEDHDTEGGALFELDRVLEKLPDVYRKIEEGKRLGNIPAGFGYDDSQNKSER